MSAIPLLIAAGATCGAAGLAAWGAVAPTSHLFGPVISATGDASAIALTFDDGPNPAVTPQLLALLHAHKVTATFFVVGKSVRAFPNLAREIAARGHVIGNHTDTHPALTFMRSQYIKDELDRCDDAILQATGAKPKWMRPPFGFRGPQLSGIVKKRGNAGVVLWSAMAWDWKVQDAANVIRRLRTVRGGDIVLLHDGDHRILEGDRRHTVAALEYWIPRWKDAGLRFINLNAITAKK